MRKYKIEFVALSKFSNQRDLDVFYADTKQEADNIINRNAKKNKGMLRKTDVLIVYIKNENGEILDKYSF